MRDTVPRQITLREADIRARLRREDPRLRGFGLDLAVAATLERERQTERDRKARRDDPRQCALAL